jgi:hypothetical protein
LEENNNNQKQKQNDEIDPFSKFLFGNSKHREAYKESENNSQEQNKHLSFQSRSNPIDDLFFESGRKESEYSTPPPRNEIEYQIEKLLKNVEVEKLTETIDMLVDTSKQFKPLFKEITPFFNQIIKKFKSK